MKSALFATYDCRNGNHEACTYTRMGAGGEPPRVLWLICDCECGHETQKQAKKAAKKFEKQWRRRQDPEYFK